MLNNIAHVYINIFYATNSDLLLIYQCLVGQQKIFKGWNKIASFHYACEKGNNIIVEYLISEGANVEINLTNLEIMF